MAHAARLLASHSFFFAFLLTLAFAAVAFAAESGVARPSSPAAAPRNDDWVVIGPGGGGSQYKPTVSPADPKNVFVRCDMTGAYVSNDGGNTWRMFNLRRPPTFFVWDPSDPDVGYAGAVGTYRTADAGRTWQLIHPDPSSVKTIVEVGDHASPLLVTATGSTDSILALAVDPKDSTALFAVIGGRAGSYVFYTSPDTGKTWRPGGNIPWGGGGRSLAGGARKIYVDPSSPEDARTVYIIGDNAVSVRQGGRWTHHPPAPGVRSFTDASAGFPEDGGAPVIYGISSGELRDGDIFGGIVISDDGGKTWRSGNKSVVSWLRPGAGAPEFRGITTCLTDPSVAYVSLARANVKDNPQPTFGIAKTTDTGRTWDYVIKEDNDTISPRVKSGWMNAWYGPEWGENPHNMGTDPNNPDVLFTTDLGRTMRSTDGLETFEAVYAKWLAPDRVSTAGIDVTTCYGVHFDPFDKNSIFISYTDIGLFRSDDRGASWVCAGVPRDWRNTTYWMTFDPDVKGLAWAVMSSVHDLPRPKMWRGRSATRYNGGVAVSTDGGKTWTKSMQGMRETAATHILMDPASPKDARVLYVTGFGTGVWKSTDGGKSWSLKNNGLPADEPFAWRLTRDKNGALYLVIARRTEEGQGDASGEGALFKSAAGAESWTPVPLPSGVNGPNGLAIDPDDPSRMYLAAWGRPGAQGDTHGGIYLTTDAGKTWKNVQSQFQHVYDVTIDPRDPKTLYACGFESSVIKSTDRGETWTRIKGFNFKWGHRVIPDPEVPGRVFVTTFGGSVWYGPSDGDPDAPEDITTPGVRYEDFKP